jgi:predicted DNA-binding WGR domain protein
MHLEIEANVFHYDGAELSDKTYHVFAVSVFQDNPETSEFVLIKRWGKRGAIGQFKAEKYEDVGALDRAASKEINNRLKKSYVGISNVTKMSEPSGSTPTLESAVTIVLSQIERYVRGGPGDVGVFSDRRLRNEILKTFSTSIHGAWDGRESIAAKVWSYKTKPAFEPERDTAWGAW